MTAVNEKAEQILSQARAQADVLIDENAKTGSGSYP